MRLPTLEDPIMKIPGRFSREAGSVCDPVASMCSSCDYSLTLFFSLLLKLLFIHDLTVISFEVSLWSVYCTCCRLRSPLLACTVVTVCALSVTSFVGPIVCILFGRTPQITSHTPNYFAYINFIWVLFKF